MSEDRFDRLERLLERMDNSGVSEFVRLSQNTGKILWLNFLSGIARGLGFTVGTAIVLAVMYKAIAELISMNIPYLTEMLTNFIDMIQLHMTK
ncbi:DUF5665 domain-containing protein [Synergistaceae bacterium OttesenSCG-928-I11]|nr:DUF5665 domain-containing protein [Synergistaceae bacterium OttesenSCG-928-I11]